MARHLYLVGQILLRLDASGTKNFNVWGRELPKTTLLIYRRFSHPFCYAIKPCPALRNAARCRTPPAPRAADCGM